MADLAPYESVIAAIIPEPSSFILGGLGIGTLLAVGWRGRRGR